MENGIETGMTAAAVAEYAAFLNAAKAVQVTTYTTSTLYRRGSAEFVARGADLFIVRGRRRECIVSGGRILVGIRTARTS